MQKVALRIDAGIAQRLLDKVLGLTLPDLEKRPNAFWLSLFRDVEVVRNTLSGPSAVLLCDLPFVLLFVGLIAVIAQPITWVLAVIVPLFVVLAWRSASVLNSASREERATGLGRDALVAEAVAGRTTVKALALDDAIRTLWQARHADTIEQSLERGAKNDFYVNVGQALTLFTTLALTTVGALAIVDQRMTIGTLIAANMLSGRVLGPYNQLVGTWRSLAQFRESVRRLGEVFALSDERTATAVDLGRPHGEVILENVTYKYAEDGAPVIDALRLKIKPGGIIGLMGPNGCGKTTLLKLVQGLYRPSSGRVLLDGADIAQFTRRELARAMGYVPQDQFLFAGSIRDNIAKGRPEASDEAILDAARKAGLHGHFLEYPDGYATEIGEAGRGNRVNGLITPGWPMTLESVAGKNPVTHVGKLYNVSASLIAEAVATLPEVSEAQCLLVSRIGEPISAPQLASRRVCLVAPAQLDDVRIQLEDIVGAELERIDRLADEFLDGRLGIDRWPLRLALAEDPRWAREREDLVRDIAAEMGSISALIGRSRPSPRVVAAMRRVPRHEFVPEYERAGAYRDAPLPIGCGQTISQPFIVALMTDLLEVSAGDRVLEVGTGSGYQAAILAEMAREVYSMELEPTLAAAASERLARLGYRNVTVRQGDGHDGWPERAPFDAIVVTAAAESTPPALLAQLKPGGRMVIPVGPSWGSQELELCRKDAAGTVSRKRSSRWRSCRFAATNTRRVDRCPSSPTSNSTAGGSSWGR